MRILIITDNQTVAGMIGGRGVLQSPYYEALYNSCVSSVYDVLHNGARPRLDYEHLIEWVPSAHNKTADHLCNLSLPDRDFDRWTEPGAE